MQNFNHQKGTHLIEILVVLAIIAISSHWVLENYERFIAVQHRKSAQSALYELAVALEEYALENQTYSEATLEALQIKTITPHKQYRLTVDRADENGFVISARPRSQQTERDKNCGILSLTSEGERFASGTQPTTCWQA